MKPDQIQDQVPRIILAELYEMWKTKSSMTPDLIAERLIRNTRHLEIPETKMLAFIGGAMESEVTELEVKELHDFS